MTMRKLGLLALACLLATSAVAGNVVKDRDWPNNAPMLALHPDGTGFLLLADPRTGRNVEATALLRIAEQQNPGLMATFGSNSFSSGWSKDGSLGGPMEPWTGVPRRTSTT